MIESCHESPRTRPRIGLEIKKADIVKNIVIATGYTTDDKELVLVKDSSMACAALGNVTRNLRLCPVRGLEVENYKVREVSTVLILAAEYKEFVALVQRCGMP